MPENLKRRLCKNFVITLLFVLALSGIAFAVWSREPAFPPPPSPPAPPGLRVWQDVASFYGAEFHGRRMANGRIFDKDDPTTAAHRELPFETKLRVRNLKNGREITVVIRDRGPFAVWRGVRYYSGWRGLDLSEAGMRELGGIRDGKIHVEISLLELPEP